MTVSQIVGVVVLAVLAVVVIGGSSWLMARDWGWRLPLALWVAVFAFSALFVIGLQLAFGGWT